MASSFDHEDVRFLLVASTQLYISRALILTADKSAAKPAQHSAYEMRAETGLEPDDARREILELALKGQALDLLRSTICPPESNATMERSPCRWHEAPISGNFQTWSVAGSTAVARALAGSGVTWTQRALAITDDGARSRMSSSPSGSRRLGALCRNRPRPLRPRPAPAPR